MNTTEPTNDIFPRDDKGPADYFTGTAWVKLDDLMKKGFLNETPF
jgi:hypothetical protein